MFTTREHYAREVVSRLNASKLSDDDVLEAVGRVTEIYLNNPEAFSNFGEVYEPIGIEEAFDWGDEGTKDYEFWRKMNDAQIALHDEILAESSVGNDFAID